MYYACCLGQGKGTVLVDNIPDWVARYRMQFRAATEIPNQAPCSATGPQSPSWRNTFFTGTFNTMSIRSKFPEFGVQYPASNYLPDAAVSIVRVLRYRGAR